MAGWLSWAWVVVAVILAIAEIFTVGFFLICFSIGAAVAAIAAFLGFAPLIQLGVFVVASALALALVRPAVNRVSNPITNPVGIDRLVGKQGIVLETIDPARGVGLVRVGHEAWSADSVDGVPYAVGTTVYVVAVDGTHLKVRLAA